MPFSDLLSGCKTLLRIGDEYDDELNIYIPSAEKKLEIAGVNIYDTSDDSAKQMYLISVAIEVSKYFDVDINLDRLNTLYLDNANALRLRND